MKRWALAAALGVVSMLPVSSPASAQATVLRATGPSLTNVRPGYRLPAGTRIQLGRADRLLVLDLGGTRDVRGPTIYVAGSRRTASAQVGRTWRTPPVRVDLGGVRGEAEVESAIQVTEAAIKASEAGDFVRSEELLRQLRERGVDHRLQCRLIDNLRIFNQIAQQLPLSPAADRDVCANIPLAADSTREQRRLDAERRALLAAQNRLPR